MDARLQLGAVGAVLLAVLVVALAVRGGGGGGGGSGRSGVGGHQSVQLLFSLDQILLQLDGLGGRQQVGLVDIWPGAIKGTLMCSDAPTSALSVLNV